MSVRASSMDVELQAIHARLMVCSTGQDNDYVLACIIASWQGGIGVLPDWLGLREEDFAALLSAHFPGFPVDSLVNPGRAMPGERFDEREEVCRLMLSERAKQTDSECWLAEIVAVACQGQDHLWQDLGLWSRSDLSDLLQRNFPALAARNVKDMKWKKFLYKQLCLAEGIYVCRAPSCEVCAEYAVCFGPED